MSRCAVTQFPVVEMPDGAHYTYLWEGDESLQVGDWVEVPPNQHKTVSQIVKVIATDSDYVGRLSNIVRKAEPPSSSPFF